MDLNATLGLGEMAIAGSPADSQDRRRKLLQRVNLRLVSEGLLPAGDQSADLQDIAGGLLQSYREMSRTLREHRCPADARIEAFLKQHFADLGLSWRPRLPDFTFVLDRHGVARELSLPPEGNEFSNSLLKSYRVVNGVLHNPRSDRRTSVGTFHVAEGGLPIPGDKKAVPKRVFAEMFSRALQPPPENLELPFTASAKEPARTFVSLLLRPTVCPEVPKVCSKKSMEVRFFAPGSLVSNLDFVESIFGSAGDPFLPENDAGLDAEHWTGHTGCVILAPHLVELTKKEVGLPHHGDATPRQRRDGMCWLDAQEKYNDGSPFKLTCRTEAGVIVTLLADNYYGYCKKEVKTQISYAANLFGNVEEEHSGGAIAFPSYSFGNEYQSDSRKVNNRTFVDVVRDYGHTMHLHPEGYGIDRLWPNLLYIPDQARAGVLRQEIWWTIDGREHSIPLVPGKIYMTPSGFKVRIEKHHGAPSWRIVGTNGEGTFCHKPCTVSGGGKSEISKSLTDYMLYGPVFVADVKKDFDLIDEIFGKDYSARWRGEAKDKPDYSGMGRGSRPLLSFQRSLGSVIKLLTPSSDYTDDYNHWLQSIPNYIYPMVFIIKRFYKPDWGGNWRQHFGVDMVNGLPGNELKIVDRKLVGTYLRVGFSGPQAWRTFKVRQDFFAAAKLQTEDDISASVVVGAKHLTHLHPGYQAASFKFATNCEFRLFQRPDEAIHRGFDHQTEADLARRDNFISNFEPLKADQVRLIVERAADFDAYTAPMQDLLKEAVRTNAAYVVASDQPRLVDGKPSKNPRYLQIRPDLTDPMSVYVAERGVRFARVVPADQPLYMPVNAVLVGRRNNPADASARIRGLAVYNPIHYQELPELFMDFVCSLTGKSPSTTGAGSEGALTKSPFNALLPTIDLNNALVSYILTGLAGFSTSAGSVGPNVRVDHDISLLVPEVWCRLTPQEREPATMIREGYLEPVQDFEHKGEKILASRLGYRITQRFTRAFFGRVFDNPSKVFDDAILQPETQDLDAFADGVKNITEAQQRVAAAYLEDQSIRTACPPLQALLSIMATGSFEGKDVHHPEIRAMFTRDSLLSSEWYHDRLRCKQQRDIALWKRHVAYLDEFLAKPTHQAEAQRLEVKERRERAAAELIRVSGAEYVTELIGTLGTDSISCKG